MCNQLVGWFGWLAGWLVGWLVGLVGGSAPVSPSSESSCRSDYCGLFTKPASTTCSHSAPPGSDKLSSLQIETNDLPLPRSPTAQLFVHVSVCMCVFERVRERDRSEGGLERSMSYQGSVAEVDYIYASLCEPGIRERKEVHLGSVKDQIAGKFFSVKHAVLGLYSVVV